MAQMKFKSQAFFGLVLMSALTAIVSCRQTSVQRARFKEGKAISLPVKLSAPLDKSTDLSFLHVLDDSGVSVYRPSVLSATLPAVPMTAIDLSKVSGKQLALTTLVPKLTYEASDGGKKKISCTGVQVKIAGTASTISCTITGDDAEGSPNDVISTLAYKIPTNLTKTQRDSWVSMVTACVKNGDKPYGNDSDKLLVGCNCSKSASKWPFVNYDEYAVASPQEATRVFLGDCLNDVGPTIVDKLVARCVALHGTDNNREGCFACPGIKDVLIQYKDFLNDSDPVTAFEQRTKLECVQ